MLHPFPRWQVMSLSSERSAAEHARGTVGDVPVRRAVESVPADLVLGVERIRDAVEIRLLRHLLVERGVEDADLRCAGQVGLACRNAAEIVRVVQRRELDVLPERLDHPSVIRTEPENVSPPCTTRWPMAWMSDLSLMTPWFRLSRIARMYSMATVWSTISPAILISSPSCRMLVSVAPLHADAFDHAAGELLLCVSVDKLILDR